MNDNPVVKIRMNVKVGGEEKVGADVDVDQIRGELEDGQVGGERERVQWKLSDPTRLSSTSAVAQSI